MSGWRVALAVFRKEGLDALRDRRALVVAGATMLAGPLLVAFVLVGVTRDDGTRGPAHVALTGGEHAPDLVRFLAEHEVVVAAGADVALAIDPGFATHLGRGEPARLTLELDSGRRGARARAERVEGVLAAYGREIAALRLLARGVDPVVASPLEVRVFDHAELSPRAAAGLATLPMFLLMATLLGCTSLAIDATAGERERKSLEGLLVHPAGAGGIAAGKWLASFAFGAVAAVGMLVVLRALFALPALARLPLPVDVGFGALARLAVLLVPFAALGAAAQLVLALRARSFKEAQGQLSLLLFAPMVPGFLFAFEPPAAGTIWHWLPVAGHQLLAVRVLAGGAVPWAPLLGLAAVCAVSAAGLVAMLARQLASEEVLAAP
jgi:sodium transport system permease protein